MPYLPLDIDAKRKLEAIERGLSLPRHTMVGGAMELWEGVWRSWSEGKSPGVAAVVDELAVAAAFGPDPRIRGALVSREFLEPMEAGWRVRGADKWLFGLEGKKRGGRAAATNGNLKQGNQAGGKLGTATPQKADSPGKLGPKLEDTSQLEPQLFHPAPSTKEEEEVAEQPPPPPQNSDGQRAMAGTGLPGLVALPDRRKAKDPPNVLRLLEQRAEPKARKQSAQAKFAAYFGACRADRFAELDRPPIPDNRWPMARLNRELEFVKTTPAEVLEAAVAAYLSDEAKGAKHPPWPLVFFVADIGTYLSKAIQEAM